MKYASYGKRALSTIIDMIIIYLFILPLYYIVPYHYNYSYELPTIFKIIYVWSIAYQTYFHVRINQTIGERYLGLKVLFDGASKHKMVMYLFRAFMKSIVLVPMAFPSISNSGIVMTIVAFIYFQFNPNFKHKKVMVWDIASDCV